MYAVPISAVIRQDYISVNVREKIFIRVDYIIVTKVFNRFFPLIFARLRIYVIIEIFII